MFFPSAPISFAVEITYTCNNACSGCANAWEAHRGQTLQNWESLFDRIAPRQNRRKYAELIRITGGEPTLHREFREIIEYIDAFDIPHALFTCGRWEHPQDIINIYLNCQNFIGMLISLHGSTELAHHAFVESTDTAFDETCENICQASQAGIDVFTNTVLTRYSCDQIEDIISLSQKLGAGCAVFNRFLGDPHPLDPTEEQFRDAILLIEKLRLKGVSCRIGNCVPQCFVENSSEGANGGIEHCIISPKGFVRPSNLLTYVFGNIFEQSVKDIWRSEQARHYRTQIPQACFECAAFSDCRGSEKSMSSQPGRFRKDPLMKSPLREITHETIVFNPELKPVPCFNIREESFGCLLTRYNWSIPLSSEARQIVNAINRENTLAQLQKQFGEDASDFVGYLYRKGFVEFDV